MAKSLARKRISTEQIGRVFDTMQGSSEQRLKELMDKTGLNAEKLIRTLSTYRARHWAHQEFPNFLNGVGKQPGKSKEDVLTALNKAGSIVKAAKLLKTTPITLHKWIGHYKLKQIIEYGGEKKVTWK